jgi:hypothetical protein
MANYNETILYGGIELFVTDITPVKNPATVKQKIGKAVVSMDVIGRDLQEYTLSVSGIIYKDTYTQLGTARGELEDLDDGEPHELVDGIHDGDFIIQTGSLQFADSGDTGNSHFRYTMTLIQKTD